MQGLPCWMVPRSGGQTILFAMHSGERFFFFLIVFYFIIGEEESNKCDGDDHLLMCDACVDVDVVGDGVV